MLSMASEPRGSWAPLGPVRNLRITHWICSTRNLYCDRAGLLGMSRREFLVYMFKSLYSEKGSSTLAVRAPYLGWDHLQHSPGTELLMRE